MSSPVRYLLLVCLFLPLVDSEKKTLCPDSKKAIFNWLPYWYELYSNQTVMGGDLHVFFKNALKVCCSTLNLTYAKMRVNSSKEIELAIRKDDSPWVSLYFPVFANKYQKEKFQRPFIGLYDSPGPIVFEIDQHKQKADAVLNALTRSWKIFALCVLLASISGVILWFLDRKHNKRELPQEFHKGSFVGLWWAFVTMTTVGYGDIVPKSFRGRLFAVIWMIIGYLALSLFNAKLTAIITSNEIPAEFSLVGKKIIIPRGGKAFLKEELNLGATQFQEVDYSELDKMIEDKTDELLMMYNYEETKMDIKLMQAFGILPIKVLKTIDHRLTIGITASGNNSNTENFLRCVEKLVVDSIVVKKNIVFAVLSSLITNKMLTSKTKNTKLQYSLETISTLVALSILILLVVVGLVLEYCGKRASTSGYSHADENHDQIEQNQKPSLPLQDQKPHNLMVEI